MKSLRRIRSLFAGRRRRVALAAVMLSLTAIFSALPTGSDPPAIPDSATPVSVIAVQLEPGYERRVRFTGKVETRRQSDLGFERPGRIISIAVDEGDDVVAGQALARLDDSSLQAEIAQAQASLRSARARQEELENGARIEHIEQAEAQLTESGHELEESHRDLVRAETLYRRGALSRSDLDRSRTRVASLQSRHRAATARLDELRRGARPEQLEAQRWEVSALEARLAGLRSELAKTWLRAPYPGRILQRILDDGAIANPGNPVLRLVEDGDLEARIGIAPETARFLRPGEQVELLAGEQSHAAKVQAVLPQVDPGMRTVPVIFSLVESGLRPGDLITFEFLSWVDTPGFRLPKTSLASASSGLWALFGVRYLGNSYQTERHLVEVLDQVENEVFVRGSLRPGDLVVVEGSHRLVQNLPVQPLPANSATAKRLQLTPGSPASIAAVLQPGGRP